MTETTEPTVEIIGWLDRNHRTLRNCPGCQVDLSTVGIVKIVYTHEVCSCDEWDYEHLVEQLWHRECFARLTAEALSRDLTSAPADAAIECLRSMLGDSPMVKFSLTLPELIDLAGQRARRRRGAWRDEQVEIVERCVRVLRAAGRLG